LLNQDKPEFLVLNTWVRKQRT